MCSHKTVFKTKWFSIEELGEDSYAEGEPYYRFKGPDAVIVFAITRDLEVILVKQNRPARGHITLEAPAGAIEAGESAEEAALRELREEAGYEPGEIHALGTGGLRLDRDSATMFGFVVFDARAIEGWVAENGIQRIPIPLRQFGLLVRHGAFEQLGAAGFALQAVLCFPDRLSELINARSEASF